MSLSGPCHRAFTAKPEEKKKTAVISLVDLVLPNIQTSWSTKQFGTGFLPSMIAASNILRLLFSSKYLPCSAISWSWAKKSTAASERKATSMFLGLHCLWILWEGVSSFFLVVLLTTERTSPKTTCRVALSSACVPSPPMIAINRPGVMGPTLWWCASLSRSFNTSIVPRLGCRKAKVSVLPVTLQWPNSLPWKRYSKVIGCPGSITGPAACCVRPVSLYPSYGLSIGK